MIYFECFDKSNWDYRYCSPYMVLFCWFLVLFISDVGWCCLLPAANLRRQIIISGERERGGRDYLLLDFRIERNGGREMSDFWQVYTKKKKERGRGPRRGISQTATVVSSNKHSRLECEHLVTLNTRLLGKRRDKRMRHNAQWLMMLIMRCKFRAYTWL
jgi:hypothetical protein